MGGTNRLRVTVGRVVERVCCKRCFATKWRERGRGCCTENKKERKLNKCSDGEGWVGTGRDGTEEKGRGEKTDAGRLFKGNVM